MKLNKQQQEAVDHYEGACTVVASAGSGKSTVLVERIRNLVHNHSEVQTGILAITFTSKTAKELKTRLESRGLSRVNVGTFHAICMRILLREGVDVRGKLVPFYKADNWFKELDERPNTEEILSFIGYQKSYMRAPEDEFAFKDSDYSDEELRKFYRVYEDNKESEGLYDFDDYLLIALELLEKNKGKYEFNHVLVDEHQDTNLVQNLILQEVTKGNNIFAVGDPRQCFPEDTPISVPNGHRKISSIREGDIVRVASGQGEYVDAPVSDVIKRDYVGTLIELTTRSGRVISATPEHMIFLRGVCTTSQSKSRITFTMFGEKDTSEHRVTVNIVNDSYIDARRITGDDQDRLLDNIERVANGQETDVAIIQRASLVKGVSGVYELLSIDNATVGMSVPALIDGEIVEDEIVEVNEIIYDGVVYDLNIDTYRNYMANDIVVHNCIYSFRAGNMKYFMNFEDYWEDPKTINMTTNYRSTSNVVEKSNNMIRPYFEGYEHYRDAVAFDESSGEIELKRYSSVAEEAVKVVDMIEEKISQGVPRNEIAVLYRLNKQSVYIENELKRREIDYDVANNSSFFRRREISAIISFLRLIIDPHDENALEEIFRFRTFPLKFFSNRLFHQIRSYSGVNDLSLFEALTMFNYDRAWQRRNALSFEQSINRLRSQHDRGVPVTRLIDNIVKAFGIEQYIDEKYTDIEDANERKESLDTLKLFVKNNNLEQFVDFIYNATTKKKVRDDAVRLVTAHSAKGLEWDNVFLIGMVDGDFPHERADVEEEARLFYVAVTRPKKNLYISEIGDGSVFVEQYFNK